MRPDMAKVVTESPRRGHSAKGLKTGKRLHKADYDADDHGSMRHPISRHRQFGWDAKEFSDLLGPLRRYLRKQVGRPWDDVYSELSAVLDKRSVSGLHIWDHIKSEVDILTWMGVSGRIYVRNGYSPTLEVNGLYVHPITHILCWVPERRFVYNKPVNNDEKILDPCQVLRREKGVWYLYTYHTVTNAYQRTNWKTKEEVVVYEDVIQLKEKRQLGKKLLKRYGLK